MRRLAVSEEHRTEFWLVGSEVYRVPLGAGTDTTGQPMGKRWECSLVHWERYRAIYAWTVDVAE